MKQRFEKYGFDVLLLEGSYVSDPNVRRALIEDGNDRCSVEQYASRYFRRQGYSALRVENEPIAALFGVFTSPLIQDNRIKFCVADTLPSRGRWTRRDRRFGCRRLSL
jgi:hypothetical protein